MYPKDNIILYCKTNLLVLKFNFMKFIILCYKYVKFT